jgi:dihydrofolate reductase
MKGWGSRNCFAAIRACTTNLGGGRIMAKLIYSTIMSVDGYVADQDGGFEWAVPDEETHTFINELQRDVGTYLYGRRLYEVMAAWEDEEAFAGEPSYIRDFARIWRSAEKVVYSNTLNFVSSSRTRIERDFNPGQVRELKSGAGGDLTVGGPELAALAFRARLVDECHIFIAPIILGGGKESFSDGYRVDLQLLDEHRFENGMTHFHFRTLP